MAHSDPVKDYLHAIDRLSELSSAVAGQRSQEEVLDAIVGLRLAVIRAYGGRRPRHRHGEGARGLILKYLLDHLGEFVYGDELAAISGIGEWARRVRELRVEEGYDIEEEAGRYRLRSRDPDLKSRERWRTVTALRDAPGEAIDRVRLLFGELPAQVVNVEELDRVAHSKDGVRLARELRENELLPVECSADAPDLQAGQYRLASIYERDHLDSSQSLFPEDTRRQVFSRDRYTCWACHKDRYTAEHVAESPFFLVVRHLDVPPERLSEISIDRLSDLTRLATFCNRCAARVGNA
ncbi:hypothetical protein A5709_25510 [Mycobacterium sp. E1386]|uniref:hypothetical protein n=1 Tax=Mycobacterium sp. E1386 TaxID=1834126 RepID=UPI0007FC5172|nr:hypothetical protein [Mycobacterium sp. E1386]OBI30472.1 hypothetical protein A5709_25510 [Mycobacterium sp. E1386]